MQNAHDEFLNARFFAGLDGLRCLSIVAVVAYHVAGSHHGLVGRGYLGVSLFFAISGFLITTLLLRERDKAGHISLRGFFARRALRIFPLYYTVLGLYAVLVFFSEKDATVRGDFFANLPAFLTYTSNWFVPPAADKRVIFYFAWSLATEEQFYLLWPLVMSLSRRTWTPVLFMGGLLAVALGAPWAVSAGYLDPSQLGGRMLTSVSASICLGCLAAHLTHSPKGFAWVSPVLGQAWSVPVMAVLLAGAVVWPEAPNWLISLVMTALVVATCIRPEQPLAPVLGHSWVRYVGTVSYGIYLLHMLALNVVRRAMPGQGAAVYFVLTLAVSVLVATLSHRYFESQFLKLKGRFDWRERPQHVPESHLPRVPQPAAREPGALVGAGAEA
ncbi:acyltransferase [Archangium sp.]|uniref:acyltransferase family protein n=1 Tax=Archangium sp. TaxID=1872627 RepID=UPI002D2E89FD|nr:acyltransferase [Archangium sp.]HYO56349.1 acyltransferase [Archangium sp.]